MSAFAALVGRSDRPAQDVVARIANIIAPLGPSGAGSWNSGPVVLLHASAPSRSGATVGPHFGAEGVVLAGDIRLDARESLVASLRAAGAAALSIDDDDGIVLAAWWAWGDDFLAHLQGDFAFALWDVERSVLVLARDPFGVRPLYYAETAHGFVASTSLGAVRAFPGVSTELEASSIVSFLRWGVVVDVGATSFRDVRRLAPGHVMTVDSDGRGAAPRRWWAFPDPPPLRVKDEREYVDAIREATYAAVRDRVRTPRAAIMLSGGVDSTGLAAAVRRALPEVSLTGFTIGVSPTTVDRETEFARLAANSLGIAHEMEVEDGMPMAYLGDRSLTTPEPFDHPQFADWRALASRIALRNPVLLVGEDGDSLFSPPAPWVMARRWGYANTAWRLAASVATRRRKPHLGLWLRRRLREGLGRNRVEMPSWVRADVLARSGPQDIAPVAGHPARPETHESLSLPMWQRLLEGFAPEYTGVPVQAVWPLLDQRLLTLVLSIPPIPWCQQKEIWRTAWRGMLPDQILDRPKTPMRGYLEGSVRRWQTACSAQVDLRSERLTDFVDKSLLLRTMQNGIATDAADAWRALALDDWLATLD